MTTKRKGIGDVELVSLVLILGCTIDINPLFDDVIWSGAAWYRVFQHGIVLSNILLLFEFAGAVALVLFGATFVCVFICVFIWGLWIAARGIASLVPPTTPR